MFLRYFLILILLSHPFFSMAIFPFNEIQYEKNQEFTKKIFKVCCSLILAAVLLHNFLPEEAEEDKGVKENKQPNTTNSFTQNNFLKIKDNNNKIINDYCSLDKNGYFTVYSYQFCTPTGYVLAKDENPFPILFVISENNKTNEKKFRSLTYLLEKCFNKIQQKKDVQLQFYLGFLTNKNRLVGLRTFDATNFHEVDNISEKSIENNRPFQFNVGENWDPFNFNFVYCIPEDPFTVRYINPETKKL